MASNQLINRKRYILIVGDIFIFYLSLALTLLIRYQSTELFNRHFWPFSFVFLVWLIVFYIDDLYELNYTQGKASLLSRTIRSFVIGALIAVLFFYLGQNRLFTLRPQTVLAINTIMAGILIYLWRIVFYSLTKSKRIARNLMIIGFNNLGQEIINAISQKPQLGFKLKKIILPPEDQSQLPESLKPYTIFNHFENLKDICIAEKIDTIIFTIHPRDNASLSKSLFNCLPLKINFFSAADFYERISGKIPIDTIEQTWFLENLAESDKKFYETVKLFFDYLLSIVLLIVSLPFIPFIILAIKSSSRGPIFFSQIRTGKDGKTFRAIKFRTMITDAEKNGPQWSVQKDPRITGVGRFFRKTRIDEIPQLLNILSGDMSLIGPRPERPEFVDQLQNQIPFYKERLLVKPGLTGWAQVMGPAYGGSVEESFKKLQYDLFYIKNRSLAVDLSIALKTIKIILSRKGQ